MTTATTGRGTPASVHRNAKGTIAIIANPGAGPVTGDTEVALAVTNAEALQADLRDRGLDASFVLLATDEDLTADEQRAAMGGFWGSRIARRYNQHDGPDVHDGRYQFRFTIDGADHLVEVPGVPTSEVRLDEHDRALIHAPRLFVDGSSWWWPSALSILAWDDENS